MLDEMEDENTWEANEKFAGVEQTKFIHADMHGNMKVILKSPAQRRYVL